MQVNHRVSRGLERLMARRAAVMLGEHYGLAGLGDVDNFPALEDALAESGVPEARKSVDTLRDLHKCGCRRVMRALPVAVDAMRMQAAGGEDAVLNGIFSKVGKALKKVAKTAVKLSPSHMLIKAVAPKAAKLSPSMLLANRISSPKSKPKTQAQLDAAAAKKAAKAATKQAKKDAKAAKKAAAALARANAQNLSPVEAGAAVLANQSGLNLTTDAAQQFAQDAVTSAGGGGGGSAPMESMYDAPADGTGDDGTIFGVPPLVAGGIAVAGVGLLWMLTKKGR